MAFIADGYGQAWYFDIKTGNFGLGTTQLEVLNNSITNGRLGPQMLTDVLL